MPTKPPDTPKHNVCLVSSSGGVLHDVMALRPWWQRHHRSWIAVSDPDTHEVLATEAVLWQPELAVRSVHRLPAAVVRAARLFRRTRTDVVVSAGTGVAVGPFIAAKLMRIPAIWIETFNMTDAPGQAAKLCMKLATVVLVQREALVSTRPRAVHIGELY